MSQYALIEDVWKDPLPSILEKTSPRVTKETTVPDVRRTLNTVYIEQGIAGIKQIVDPSIIRDIQAEALAAHRAVKHTHFSLELSRDDWVYVLLGLFAILFAVDSKSS